MHQTTSSSLKIPDQLIKINYQILARLTMLVINSMFRCPKVPVKKSILKLIQPKKSNIDLTFLGIYIIWLRRVLKFVKSNNSITVLKISGELFS